MLILLPAKLPQLSCHLVIIQLLFFWCQGNFKHIEKKTLRDLEMISVHAKFRFFFFSLKKSGVGHLGMLTITILYIMKIYDIILTCSLGQDDLHANTCIMNGIYWLNHQSNTQSSLI